MTFNVTNLKMERNQGTSIKLKIIAYEKNLLLYLQLVGARFGFFTYICDRGVDTCVEEFELMQITMNLLILKKLY